MYSGWGAKVGDPDAYRGTDAAGTLSIDPGNSTTFETHLILTGADRYGPAARLAPGDRVGLHRHEAGTGTDEFRRVRRLELMSVTTEEGDR
jgi:hypothetical protein